MNKEISIKEQLKSISEDMELVMEMANDDDFHQPLTGDNKASVVADIDGHLRHLLSETGEMKGLFVAAINSNNEVMIVNSGTVPALARLAATISHENVALVQKVAQEIRHDLQMAEHEAEAYDTEAL